jgi:hypothetical protein
MEYLANHQGLSVIMYVCSVSQEASECLESTQTNLGLMQANQSRVKNTASTSNCGNEKIILRLSFFVIH